MIKRTIGMAAFSLFFFANSCMATDAVNCNVMAPSNGSISGSNATCWNTGQNNYTLSVGPNATITTNLMCNNGTSGSWAPSSVTLHCTSDSIDINNWHLYGTSTAFNANNNTSDGTRHIYVDNMVCSTTNTAKTNVTTKVTLQDCAGGSTYPTL